MLENENLISEDEKKFFICVHNLYKEKKYTKAKELINSNTKFKNSFILNNLNGLLEYEFKNYEKSIIFFRKSYNINNSFKEAKKNEVFSLIKLNKLDEAEKILKSIIEKNKNDLDCVYTLGNLYFSKNSFSLSQKCYEDILYRDKNYYKAYYAISRIFKQKNNYRKALNYCVKALRIKNNFPDALYSISLILLRKSKFKYGWKYYESRFSKTDPTVIIGNEKVLPVKKIWTGDLSKKLKILFVTEQGKGDTFQYIRYIGIFKDYGFETFLLTTPNLSKILSSYEKVDKIFTDIKNININFDYWLPLMSAPYKIYNQIKYIPNNTPYLFSDSILKKKWSKKIGDKINIGICWKGSIKERNFDINKLSFLVGLKNKINLVSLQADNFKNDIKDDNLNKMINCYEKIEDKQNSFVDTAAIIGNMQLVISCDTSIAHLSSAMNIKTLLVLNPNHYWTWQENKSFSPWYPSMTILHIDNTDQSTIKFRDKIFNMIK